MADGGRTVGRATRNIDFSIKSRSANRKEKSERGRRHLRARVEGRREGVPNRKGLFI